MFISYQAFITWCWISIYHSFQYMPAEVASMLIVEKIDLNYSSFGVVTEWESILSKDRLASGGRLNKKDGLTRYGDSHVR